MAYGRKTGGRTVGVPNKATADVRAAAQEYGPQAIRALAALAGLLDEGAGKAESEQAQVAAIKEILDRAYGKAQQAIEHSGTLTVDNLADRIQRAKKRK